MRQIAIFLTLLFFLSACNLPREQGVSGFSLTDQPVITDIPTITSTPTLTVTPTIAYEQCGWNWATQPLPGLSAEVQSALEAAGLTTTIARAEAFGENCFSQNNEVLYFAAMETDFHISVEADDLTDTTALGNLLERILVVLDTFSGTTPGPHPGYIGISFTRAQETLNLWFAVTDGESARALGLHGADLLAELQNR
jgi:hypothetical protein